MKRFVHSNPLKAARAQVRTPRLRAPARLPTLDPARLSGRFSLQRLLWLFGASASARR
jgi:hypothetical protein